MQIGREQMRRRLIVQANVRGRDMVGFVRDAQARVKRLTLPKSVELEWGGQFQNFNRAKDRLDAARAAVARRHRADARHDVPQRCATRWSRSFNLPFAIAGGAAALVARGLPFSIPAGVGFIALCGVSVMNGVVHRDPPERAARVAAAHRCASSARRSSSLRAIMSTALVAAIGFVPAAIASGTGAEVQRPLATVVIGGLVASMLLSLPAMPTMLLLVTPRARTEPPESG